MALKLRKPKAKPLKALIYGPPGVGKSTLAAGAPKPLFLDFEEGTEELDVDAVDCVTWADFERAKPDIVQSGYQTIVLDTLDSLERVMIADIVNHDGSRDLASVGRGFGEGTKRLEKRLHDLTEWLTNLRKHCGMHVLILAHAAVKKSNDPNTAEEWDRWTLGVNKRTSHVFRGWVSELWLLNRVVVKQRKKDTHGTDKGLFLFTRNDAGRLAKTRVGLPERIQIPDTPHEPGRCWDAVWSSVTQLARKPLPVSIGADHVLTAADVRLLTDAINTELGEDKARIPAKQVSLRVEDATATQRILGDLDAEMRRRISVIPVAKALLKAHRRRYVERAKALPADWQAGIKFDERKTPTDTLVEAVDAYAMAAELPTDAAGLAPLFAAADLEPAALWEMPQSALKALRSAWRRAQKAAEKVQA